MSLLLALTGTTGVTGTLAWTSEGDTWAIASTVTNVDSTLQWTSQNDVWALAGNVPVEQTTLGGVHAPYAPWSITRGLTPELREQIRKQLEAETEPVREVITAQAKTKFESMEAEEKALQAAILAAQLEYDALYLRLVAYKRDQMEEEAIVLTMMSLL